MNDTSEPTGSDTSVASGAAKAADKANQLWSDLIPVIAFVAVYNGMRIAGLDTELFNKDTALYWATGVLVVLTLGFIALRLIRGQKVPLFMLVSSGIVGGFGILGIVLQEKSFIYIKPTIQQLFLASLIFGSLALGKNIWKVMFSQVFALPDFAWRTLAIRWGFYFVAMALWNEFLWRYYVPGFEEPLKMAGLTLAPAGEYSFLGLTFGAREAEDVWANWKLGNMVITVIWAIANTPYTLKHLQDDETEAETGAA